MIRLAYARSVLRSEPVTSNQVDVGPGPRRVVQNKHIEERHMATNELLYKNAGGTEAKHENESKPPRAYITQPREKLTAKPGGQ